MPMLLSIIIVNYKTKTLTLECLKSVFTFLDNKIPFEIIIVDNNSRDGSAEAFRQFGSDRANVHVIESEKNFGFAKGNNVGIEKAKGGLVLLLNSDTYLIDDSITQAVAFLDKNPDVFGCGCALLNADGSIGISYGRFPQLAVVLCEIITWRLGRFHGVIPRRPSVIRDIDFPCGAFFLIKRDLMEKIGLLDERFFMYFEETDWAKRAKYAGYRIVHFGPTRVVHLRGQSIGGDGKKFSQSIDLKVAMYRSWRRYLTKHCPAIERALVGALLSLFLRANYLIFYLLQRDKARLQYANEIKAFRAGWRVA